MNEICNANESAAYQTFPDERVKPDTYYWPNNERYRRTPPLERNRPSSYPNQSKQSMIKMWEEESNKLGLKMCNEENYSYINSIIISLNEEIQTVDECTLASQQLKLSYGVRDIVIDKKLKSCEDKIIHAAKVIQDNRDYYESKKNSSLSEYRHAMEWQKTHPSSSLIFTIVKE